MALKINETLPGGAPSQYLRLRDIKVLRHGEPRLSVIEEFYRDEQTRRSGLPPITEPTGSSMPLIAPVESVVMWAAYRARQLRLADASDTDDADPAGWTRAVELLTDAELDAAEVTMRSAVEAERDRRSRIAADAERLRDETTNHSTDQPAQMGLYRFRADDGFEAMEMALSGANFARGPAIVRLTSGEVRSSESAELTLTEDEIQLHIDTNEPLSIRRGQTLAGAGISTIEMVFISPSDEEAS